MLRKGGSYCSICDTLHGTQGDHDSEVNIFIEGIDREKLHCKQILGLLRDQHGVAINLFKMATVEQISLTTNDRCTTSGVDVELHYLLIMLILIILLLYLLYCY